MVLYSVRLTAVALHMRWLARTGAMIVDKSITAMRTLSVYCDSSEPLVVGQLTD